MLRVRDKFWYISYSHFFSALVIDSGRLETLEALYLLVKIKSIYRKLIHRLNLF